MTKLGWKRALAAGAAGAAIVVGGGAALAASGDDSSSTSFFDAVARHLGISSETLEDATKAAAIEQVDAALEAGDLTQEQADELKARIESGEGAHLFGRGFRFGFDGPPGGKGFRGHGPGFGFGFGFGLHGDSSAVTDYLGITAEELRERLANGDSLADIAEAEGKSVDGLKEAMLAASRERLDEAVENGRLTREQADAFLAKLDEMLDNVVEGTFPGPRWRHGPGGPFGQEPGEPGEPQSDGSGGSAPAPDAGVL